MFTPSRSGHGGVDDLPSSDHSVNRRSFTGSLQEAVSMARARRLDSEALDDPFMLQFDKGMALLSYGLLFIAPFGVGLPAMASLALAFAHRLDTHAVIRSHYRFQGRIFWTAAALLVIGVGLLLVGASLEATTVVGWIQARIGGLVLPNWLVSAYADQNEQDASNGMMIGGVISIVVAIGWLMLASLWGAFKLVLGRPMGQRR
jgi:uncharacterized membrane protein